MTVGQLLDLELALRAMDPTEHLRIAQQVATEILEEEEKASEWPIASRTIRWPRQGRISIKSHQEQVQAFEERMRTWTRDRIKRRIKELTDRRRRREDSDSTGGTSA